MHLHVSRARRAGRARSLPELRRSSPSRDSLTIVSARWAIAGLVVSILGLGLLTALTYRAAVSGALASAGAVVLFALALGIAWASSRPKLKRRP